MNMFLCSVDFEKAFDRVPHKMLIKLVKNKGIDESKCEYVESFHCKQETNIRRKGNMTVMCISKYY